MRCPEVQQTLVVGVPDPRLFEEVCACIIPHPGQSLAEDQLRQLCDESLLATTALLDTILSLKNFPKATPGSLT